MAPYWNGDASVRPFDYDPIDVRTGMITPDRLGLIVVGAVFTAIGAVTMLLRLVTILQKKRVAGTDDLSSLVGWLFSIAFAAASYQSVRWGVGLMEKNTPLGWGLKAIKTVFLVQIFYWPSIYFGKLSLLCLYIRITRNSTSNLRLLSLLTMVILSLQFISTLIVTGLQCIPAERYWNPQTPGKCINIAAFFYFTNAWTILTDIWIICIPIATIWRLKQPSREKWLILSVFLVGGVSTISSCVRLYTVHVYTSSRGHEPMRDAAPINMWSFIEINLSILGSSAPALKALWKERKEREPGWKPRMVNLGLGISRDGAARLEEVENTAVGGQRQVQVIRDGSERPGLMLFSFEEVMAEGRRLKERAGRDRESVGSDLTLVDPVPEKEEKV